MTAGYTDRETINQRRPLTPNMARVLGLIGDGWPQCHFDQGEQNAARALKDRGLVEVTEDGRNYRLTEFGSSRSLHYRNDPEA